MPEPPLIGGVGLVNLDIFKGQDLSVDIKWWADEAKTTWVRVGSVVSLAKVQDQVVLDIGYYCSIDSDGIVHLNISGATTAMLAPVVYARWDMELTSADSGEVRKLAGRLRIRDEVTV